MTIIAQAAHCPSVFKSKGGTSRGALLVRVSSSERGVVWQVEEGAKLWHAQLCRWRTLFVGLLIALGCLHVGRSRLMFAVQLQVHCRKLLVRGPSIRP